MKLLLATILLVSASAHADEALFAEAKQEVSKNLKDPYSAVFEGMYLGKTANGTPVVCGTVNAKNSYGAFTGRKRFYFVASGKIADIPAPDDVVLKSFCG